MIFRQRVGGENLIIECDEYLEAQVRLVFRSIESAVGQGLELRVGTRIQIGWSVLTLREDADGLRVCEPIFRKDLANELNSTLDITLGVLLSQVQILHRVAAEGMDVVYWQAVLARRDAIATAEIYLKRTVPIRKHDSGWYIGDLNAIEDATEEETEAIEISQLLTSRPAVLQLLALPPGFIATMRDESILQIFDQNGVDRWAIEK
jgi:hypothetical protein